MIRTKFTSEDFNLAKAEYMKRNKIYNKPAICGLCAEIALHKLAGLEWKFTWDASDIRLRGEEYQQKSRLENDVKKTRFNVDHKSDYSNIRGFIFSKVYLNADNSGQVMTYPNALDRYYVEGNAYSFKVYGRHIDESKIIGCDERYKIPLEEMFTPL